MQAQLQAEHDVPVVADMPADDPRSAGGTLKAADYLSFSDAWIAPSLDVVEQVSSACGTLSLPKANKSNTSARRARSARLLA